jgi:hypothetical protein
MRRMGATAGFLAVIHVIGCAVIAYLGLVYWGLSASEGDTPGSVVGYLVLGTVLFLAAVGASLALLLGRRLVAAAILVVEVAVGAVIVTWALEASVHGDLWIWVGALVVAGSGFGAVAGAERADRPRAPG